MKMHETKTGNRQNASIDPTWGALALTALSTLAGCSQTVNWSNAGADTSKPVPTATTAVDGLSYTKEVKVVSLADAPSHLVSLAKKVSYVVRVPPGSYKVVFGAVDRSDEFLTRYPIDDKFVFIVPENPEKYAVRIATKDGKRRDRGFPTPADGTYITLHDKATEALVSGVKLPIPSYLGSSYTPYTGDANHGNFVFIESAATGERFKVPSPRIVPWANFDDVKEVHRKLCPPPEISRL